MSSRIDRTRGLSAGISCAFALWVFFGCAQDASAQAGGLQQRLDQCLLIVNDTDRLRCFEIVAQGGTLGQEPAEVARPSSSAQTATGLEKEDQGKKLRAAASKGRADQGDRTSQKAEAPSDEDRFGLPERRAPKIEEERRVLTVSKVRQSRRGGWLFLMENGQIWRQTDGLTIPEPAAGDRADIEKGFLGGFLMRINSRTIRVKREK